MKNNPIFKILSQFIFPYIILFSLYIQINGEVSPGGGFQAGVIFSSAFICLHITGNEKIIGSVSPKLLISLSAIGVLIYFLTGIAPMIFNNSNFLDYYGLIKGKKAQALGIFLVEIGVGLTVSSVTYLIFLLFKNHDDF